MLPMNENIWDGELIRRVVQMLLQSKSIFYGFQVDFSVCRTKGLEQRFCGGAVCADCAAEDEDFVVAEKFCEASRNGHEEKVLFIMYIDI